MLLQKLEELVPGRGISGLVALLDDIPARRVDEHGLVREPPVAVARAADPLDRPLAELVGEGEVQIGVDQRRGLARPRRADDDVPSRRGFWSVATRRIVYCILFAIGLPAGSMGRFHDR